MKASSIILIVVTFGLLAGPGCARRMTIATGTTIGLHATPGDGQSQSPQVTLAYKRAETALIPTAGKAATNSPASDAYSSLAIVDFRTRWFGKTSIDQFIATGFASRDIQARGSAFPSALAGGGDVRDRVVEANIYQALQSRAAGGDSEAALAVRDMDALGELEPDDYLYLDVASNAEEGMVRVFGRRDSQVDYGTFARYRARLIGSLNILNAGSTVKVKELNNDVRELKGESLKRERNKFEGLLTALQRKVSDRGATSRALELYCQSLKR